jgi:radical SAM/Cys-rich protein
MSVQHFAEKIRQDGDSFRKRKVDVLQINMGKYCNQACLHCHVEAGPTRKEMMTLETVETILRFLATSDINKVDITGGAPELNPHFDYLVERCVQLGRHVMDRCNLTVIFESRKDYLPSFFQRNRVELICSLPCYTEKNVDQQRGKGTFHQSILALKLLNRLGYGITDTGLELQLVYNPVGAHLPPPQDRLERDYRNILKEEYGIVFNHLFCLTNMPITRFEKFLKLRNEYHPYMELIESAFNPATLEKVMCRNLLSVGWEGSIYDCDFNQMLELPLQDRQGRPLQISDLCANGLEDQSIIVGDHCYACTAGAGSSCGGSLIT